jgi:creatinine amidohydrolase
MELALCTWREIEAYLERARGIIIPVGSTEQHGPNGLIGTDAICPETIARRIGEAEDVLVGPTIAFGAAQFNLGFPGTISTRPTTLIALVVDIVESLAVAGFRHIYFLNGHGGNVAPLKSAFQEVYGVRSRAVGDGRAALRCRVRSWWELPAVDRLRDTLYGAREGMHATPSEVAITQFACPGSVRKTRMAAWQQLPENFMRDHAGDDHGPADLHRRRFPDGRVGSDPSRATPHDGAALVAAAVADGAADYRAFLAED